MVVKMSAPGRSFGGVADYCLHDRRVPGEEAPKSSERVEWTETRNLATSQGQRAARIMAATAEAGPELKRLSGVVATGRKLEMPVCHYSLSWAKEEKPERQEMRRAAEESLKELGMEGHQALIVSHRDGKPHVHVIANRVDPENGKAEGLSRSKLKLSRWAEKYEWEQGKIRCPKREINNMRRSVGARVVDGRGHSGGRWRRERMNPEEERKVIPAGRNREEQEQVVWCGRRSARTGSGFSSVGRRRWRRVGGADQEGVVGALWASRAGAGAAGARLPWSIGAVAAVAVGGERTARDRGGAGREFGSAERSWRSWSSGNGGSGSRWESAFRSGAWDRAQGGRGLPQRLGRVAGTGVGGGGWAHGVLQSFDRWVQALALGVEERMEQARELYGRGCLREDERAEERASRPMLPSHSPAREAQERSRLERDYGPGR